MLFWALFATYASRFDRVENLVSAADPTLQRLSEETGETVNLAMPGPKGVAQVAQVDSTFVLGATSWADVEPLTTDELDARLYHRPRPEEGERPRPDPV